MVYRLYHWTRACTRPPHRGCPVFSAHVTPNLAGQHVTIELEMLKGTHWIPVLHSTATLGRTSTASVLFYYRNDAVPYWSTRVRAVYRATSAHAAAHSAWLYYRVQ